MAVYISFDFDDRPSFDNVRDALEQAGLECWDPDSVLAGNLLAESLRKAIIASDLCVFVATTRSVASAWCGAELGAFWGSGKPVLVFIADSSMSETALPRQFLGHYCERRTKKLVEAVEAKLKGLSDQAITRPVTPEMFKEMIDSALDRALSAQQLTRTFDELAEMLATGLGSDESRFRARLSRLLGRSTAEISAFASHALRFAFTLETTTGTWHGYAQEQLLHGPEHAPDVVSQQRCILVYFDDRDRVISVAAAGNIIEGHNQGVTTTKFFGERIEVGRRRLGEAIPDQHF